MKFEIEKENEAETEEIVKFKLKIDSEGDLVLYANNVRLLYVDCKLNTLWRIYQPSSTPFIMDEHERIKDETA